MATQVTLGSGVIDSASGLKLRTNGTTEAVDISTAQVATLAKDAVVNGLTVGRGAGAVSTNTAVGASALAANTTGNNNTAVGQTALTTNTSGNFNTAVGRQSLFANTSGTDNSGFGLNSLVSNTTGSYNTAIGRDSLQANTTASNNTAVGYQAGYSTSTGADNLFFGYQAGYSNVTGTLNTYLGRWAGKNGTGDNNTYVGLNAGYQSTGSRNTFVGARSTTESCGGAMTTGSANTIIGAYSGNQGGLDIRTASNYIVLSDGDGNPRGIFDSSGNWLVGTTTTGFSNTRSFTFQGVGDGKVYLNHSTANTSGDGYIGFGYGGGQIGSITQSGTTAVAYNTSSDYRLKENIAPMTGALAKVAALKPVTYNWKADGSDGEGFIAHELAEVVPQCVTGEKDAVETYTDENGNEQTRPVYQGIDTSFLVATLTAAIQELKAIVDAQAVEIAALKGTA